MNRLDSYRPKEYAGRPCGSKIIDAFTIPEFSPNSYILPNTVESSGYLAVDLALADVSQQSSPISLEQS